MKPSERIKQEIETLLDELKDLGYKVEINNNLYCIYNDSYVGYFTLNESTNLQTIDKITENLLKLKARI